MNQYNKITRFFAIVLVAGGIAGIVIFGIIGIRAIKQSWVPILLIGVLIALFLWSVFTGFRLWQGTPYGRKWAIILFASQIPILSRPGFEYRWYTGANFNLILRSVNNSVNIDWGAAIGSGCGFSIGAGVDTIEIGVNLFAVIALILLMHANNSFKLKPLLGTS